MEQQIRRFLQKRRTERQQQLGRMQPEPVESRIVQDRMAAMMAAYPEAVPDLTQAAGGKTHAQRLETCRNCQIGQACSETLAAGKSPDRAMRALCPNLHTELLPQHPGKTGD